MDETVALKRAPDDPNVWTDNSVEIFVNPTGDRKTLYQLILNSMGSSSYRAYFRGKDGRRTSDPKWRPAGAEAKATRTPSGWRAAFAIPLAELPGMKSAVPMNFGRNRGLKDGTTCILWGDYPNNYSDAANFGTVVFEDEGK